MLRLLVVASLFLQAPAPTPPAPAPDKDKPVPAVVPDTKPKPPPKPVVVNTDAYRTVVQLDLSPSKTPTPPPPVRDQIKDEMTAESETMLLLWKEGAPPDLEWNVFATDAAGKIINRIQCHVDKGERALVLPLFKSGPRQFAITATAVIDGKPATFIRTILRVVDADPVKPPLPTPDPAPPTPTPTPLPTPDPAPQPPAPQPVPDSIYLARLSAALARDQAAGGGTTAGMTQLITFFAALGDLNRYERINQIYAEMAGLYAGMKADWASTRTEINAILTETVQKYVSQPLTPETKAASALVFRQIATALVQASKTTPQPVPVPPTDTKLKGELFITIVHDPEDRSVALANVLFAKETREWCKANNAKPLLTISSDDPKAERLRPALDAAKNPDGSKPKHVIVIQETGGDRRWVAAPLPLKTAEVLQLLGAHRG